MNAKKFTLSGVTELLRVPRGRFHRSLRSAIVFLFVAVTGTAASAAEGVLLAFSSQRCEACKAMQPTLDRLAGRRILVRHVDVGTEPDFARRHGIRHTPTFVVWKGGREMTRLVGMQSEQRLLSALSIDPSGPQVLTNAKVPGNASPNAGNLSLNAPQTRLVATNANRAAMRAEPMPSLSLADAVQRARAATVRLKVRDGRGFGVGTGTIIDRHGEEALILTCGHLFRETKFESRVDVELFVGGEIRTVAGQVVDYDAGDRDIGLVVIRPGFDVTAVDVISMGDVPQTGQSVFSFGCDHGADPSRRDTRITGVDKYNQHLNASNLEIAGAPVDGRSGGGLFDHQGRLIGVCNAADYKGDVGIYTGPGSIRWQLDRVQLSHLYQGGASNTVSAPAPAPANAPATVTAPAPATNPAMTHGQPLAVQPASFQSQAVSGAPSQMREVIVVVRDPSRPDSSRVITVSNPTSELLDMIQRHANP